MNIILSIHPKWATLIYSGKKTIEIRKSFPKIYYPLMKIFIYETAPVCRVTGYFTWSGTKRFQNVDWTKADAYHKKILDAGCVPAEELNTYQGQRKMICGWGVEKTKKFDNPLPLEYFGITAPPQSWCYTEVEVLELFNSARRDIECYINQPAIREAIENHKSNWVPDSKGGEPNHR